MYKKIVSILLILTAISPKIWAQKHLITIIGHEGAKGAMPENSIEGMKKALDLSADALQTEVVITKDGKVVMSHEPYFNHQTTFTPKGKTFKIDDEPDYNIFQMNYDEVKKFDVGSKVNPDFPGQQKFKSSKPLLSDLFDEIEPYLREKKLNKKLTYFIEIKTIPNGEEKFHPKIAEFVDIVIDVINAHKMANRVVLVSLDPKVLQYIHGYYKKIKTGYMVENKTDYDENIADLTFKPTYYIPYYPLVGVSLVNKCHQDKVKIAPWVVNSSKFIGNLIDWKADAVITDYPNLYEVLYPPKEVKNLESKDENGRDYAEDHQKGNPKF